MNYVNSNLPNNPSENNTAILIAEDDLTARNILAGITRKWGFTPITVIDGRAAWEILQEENCPRLAILDWVMPEMDGLEVIRRVRAQMTDQPPYIILLTSKDEKGDIISGLETGANDYIKKPFDQEELYARIRVGQRTIELQTKLLKTQYTLSHLATHDPLTGILTRRAILEQLAKEISRSDRHKDCTNCKSLSIGYLDIDHFKQINDVYGHQVGDEILKKFVDILASQLRAYDSFGRLGGDEFLVIAPGTATENCLHLFERLAKSISLSRIVTGPGVVTITVSIGVVCVGIEDGLDKLLDAADSAMYQAKRQGGNCVIYAG
jgi:two-component system, cell cycle response regulator